MTEARSSPSASSHVREGRLVERRAVEDLKQGDLVQHYSTWEQTYGEPIRRVVVDVKPVPFDDQNRLLVTWHDPADGDSPVDDFDTRMRRGGMVDLIIGDPPPPPITEDEVDVAWEAWHGSWRDGAMTGREGMRRALLAFLDARSKAST